MRNSFLDATRALLCWLIVGVHVTWFADLHTATWHWIGVWTVSAFVLLSGYCIGNLLLRKKERFDVFLYRRFMRLAPCYFVCLGVAIALRPLTYGLPQEAERELYENSHWWDQILWHVSLIHGLGPGLTPYTLLAPAWSTSLEWMLYLCAVPLLWVLARTPRALTWPAIFAGLILGAFGVSEKFPVPSASPIARIGFFGAGMLLAVRGFSFPEARVPGWLVAEGKKSYATFLCHYPLLNALAAGMPLDRNPWDKALMLYVLGPPLIIFSAAKLHFLVELPFIELGKTLFRPKPNRIFTHR